MSTDNVRVIRIETTDFGVLVRLFKELLDRGLKFKNRDIDLKFEKDQEIIPITSEGLVSTRFRMDDNHILLTEAWFYKNIPSIKIVMFLDKLRVRYNTQNPKQPDLDTCSKFSKIQQNAKEIVDLIEKITVGKLCDERFNSEFVNIRTIDNSRLADQIFERTISIVKIPEYKEYIDTLYDVDLEEQYKLYDFLRNNIENEVSYRFKDFTLFCRNDILEIRFLGMLIAMMNFRRNSLENYFRYFRHRGMSFFANYLKRASQFDAFEKYIHAKSLKSQIM